MSLNLSNYRKLIAAVLGVFAIIIGPDVLGVTDTAGADTIVQAILGVLTALGVWGVANTSSEGSPTVRSPALVGLFALLLALAMGGCSTLGIKNERLDTANKQLADKVLFVKVVANFATRLTVTGVIDRDQAIRVADLLDAQLRILDETQRAVAENGDPSQVPDTLARVDQTLAIVLDLLTVFAPTETSAIMTLSEYSRVAPSAVRVAL